jgi:murein DD-endopeptidase MepM/ murein hydrolase activator NlpD
MAVTKVTQGVSLDPAKNTDADREEIRRLAQQFEAILMTQMLREMRRSMLDEDEEDTGFGSNALTDTADVEFGQALSRSGGFGLTSALLETFERQILGRAEEAGRAGRAGEVGQAEGTDEAPTATTTGEVATAAVTASDAKTTAAAIDRDIAEAAPISSPFGWRRDPLTGAARFHHGIDIALAYGRDVKAAAGGIVSFAGEQDGYGQTVVVDHEGGRQTRYAHLSGQVVRAGDRVAEGQVIGRSGNSGRSTGPHLHFEMLVDGRPVNPAAQSGRVPDAD